MKREQLFTRQAPENPINGILENLVEATRKLPLQSGYDSAMRINTGKLVVDTIWVEEANRIGAGFLPTLLESDAPESDLYVNFLEAAGALPPSNQLFSGYTALALDYVTEKVRDNPSLATPALAKAALPLTQSKDSTIALKAAVLEDNIGGGTARYEAPRSLLKLVI